MCIYIYTYIQCIYIYTRIYSVYKNIYMSATDVHDPTKLTIFKRIS